ncbi:MAG: complex I subunit 5 family protein [Candidatus Onthomonas sp.]
MMSGIWFLIAILIPIVTGACLLVQRNTPRRVRETLLLTSAAVTSLIVLGILLLRPEEITLLRLNESLRLAFRLDSLSMVFAAILAVLWPIADLYSFEYMSHEHGENRFFGFFTMTYGVVLGIAFASNAFTLYLCYELMTLCTLPLVMHEMDGKSRWAGKKYLLFSMGGAAFAFISLVFLTSYGSLDFTLGGSLDPTLIAGAENTLRIVFVLAFFGYGVKAAVFPFHSWLPAAGVAPTPVSALLHAVAVVNSGVFAVLRLTYYSFGTELLRGTFAQWVMMGACSFTILFGSAMAWRLQHFKRRLAMSTVSNLSYILLGVSVMTPAGLTGALLHMAAHSVFKIILFFCAGAVICQTHREYVFQLSGLGRKMPLTFAAFAVASFGLIGIPPFAGFFSKWEIAAAAVELHRPLAYLGAFALVLSAFLTGLYQLEVLMNAFFPGADADLSQNKSVREVGWRMKTAFVLLIVLAALISLLIQPLTAALTGAAQGLL